jgi:hypothetical protein
MIHGINLDGEIPQEDEDEDADFENEVVKPKPIKRQSPLMFGDPAEYAKMDPEKCEELTNKMMNKWSKWAGKGTHPLGQRKRK